MGVGQGGQVFVFFRKVRYGGNGVQKQSSDAPQGISLKNQIGIVTHIAAGGSQMDDGLCLGAGKAKGIDMGHDVVAHLCLPLAGGLIVYIIDVGAHLVYLFLAYIQSQLLLALCQYDPEFAPGGKLPVVGEYLLHLPAGIALAQGIVISVLQYHVLLSLFYGD